MGHFSFTCHLSGLPITGGTKAVLLPIFPKSHWGYDNSQENLQKYGKNNLCSNDGPNMYFDEFCFPIFGEYDSYGRLENIEHDDNTKVLEEFFSLSIEDIATVICDGRKDEYEEAGQFCDSVKILDKNNPKHEILLRVSATWYHREVYDKLSKIDSKDYFDKLDLGTHGILVALGFSYVGTDNTERYNKVYEKDGLKIHSDGTWINIPKEQIYNISDLKKYCAKQGVEIDPSKIEGGRYSQLYDFVLSYANKPTDFMRERSLIHMLLGDEYKLNSHSFELYEMLKEKGLLSDSDKSYEILSKIEKTVSKSLPLFYFMKIKENGNNFMKDNIVSWYNVKQYYYPTGRFLYPVGTSVQDGDHKKVQILLQTALEVVTEELKGYDDYDDEDED